MPACLLACTAGTTGGGGGKSQTLALRNPIPNCNGGEQTDDNISGDPSLCIHTHKRMKRSPNTNAGGEEKRCACGGSRWSPSDPLPLQGSGDGDHTDHPQRPGLPDPVGGGGRGVPTSR